MSRKDLCVIAQIQSRLERYFTQDVEQRFKLESFIGGGANGLTWKLKYNASSGPTSTQSDSAPTNVTRTSDSQPNFRRIVLKTVQFIPRFGDDDMDVDGGSDREDKSEDIEAPFEFRNEKAMLQVMRWAKHIANAVDISNDPLTRTFPGTPSHQMLRMVIAMGWPPKKPDGENPQPVIEQINGIAKGALVHRDIFLDHDVGNIMIGGLQPKDPGLEHTLTPMLQLIDLGGMRKLWGPTAASRAVCDNLFQIGLVMILFITLDHTIPQDIFFNPHDPKPFRAHGGSPEFLTHGGILVDDENGNNPFPWLDRDLRIVVCSCLAATEEHRPSPQDLLTQTITCLRDKDEQFYARQPEYDGVSESDERIRSILSVLVFNA
ncbi:hypothetical protein E0Z10_g3970 [Xylaria hypoxylon]|uniref:Protein kinase domain-containing protein n=1 Tax=Xylaria hypoxylon TaxID=37992 RepID=A0A4Z0YZX1_9PEZI|nr:hypothetical protein E0Z10_g3970 [Xylaria hypoxylon]